MSNRYAALLSGLDATDPRSFCVARAELRERLPQAEAADASAMFRAFRAYYRDGDRTTYRRFDAAVKPFERDVLEWTMRAGSMGVE